MRRGFTLIELLVVIAIIAILAAILFPVFVGAKSKAQMTQCLAHGKQLGQATMMYMTDNDQRFPSAATQEMIDAVGSWTYDWEGTGLRVWKATLGQYRYITLRRYVKNESIWVCPTGDTGAYGRRYKHGYRSNWLPRTTDDFVDGDRGFWDETSGRGIGRTVTEVQWLDMKGETACGPRYMPPSKKILWTCYALGEWAIGNVGDGTPVWKKCFPWYPHNGGTTYVYADGHAQWQKTGKAWAPIGYTKLWMDQAPSKQ